MSVRYWVTSRETIKRAIQTGGMFYVQSTEIIASDYETSRQHIRALVRLVTAPVWLDVSDIKKAIQGSFCKDMTVMNVSYLRHGLYAVNIDTKLTTNQAISEVLQEGDLRWLGSQND